MEQKADPTVCQDCTRLHSTDQFCPRRLALLLLSGSAPFPRLSEADERWLSTRKNFNLEAIVEEAIVDHQEFDPTVIKEEIKPLGEKQK